MIGREFSILDVILETNMFTSIISLVVGMWLLLGSRGLVHFIRRLRRPRFEDDEPESIVPGASPQGVDVG